MLFTFNIKLLFNSYYFFQIPVHGWFKWGHNDKKEYLLYLTDDLISFQNLILNKIGDSVICAHALNVSILRYMYSTCNNKLFKLKIIN